MMIGLKLPIAALLYIVWWAVHATPDEEEAPEGEGGTRRPPHPRRPLPRTPRRGPHGDPLPSAPARTRVTRVVSRRTSA